MARRVNENKEVAEVDVLQPVAVVQPAAGWWSGSGNLGVEVSFAPDSENRQTILKLPEYGMPEIWTISLFLRDANVAYSALSIKAVIEFGAGGSTQTVEIDWTHGTQISLPMNAVNVIAEFADIGGVVASEGAGLRLGVQVAKGRRGGNLTPKFTIDESVIAPSGGGAPAVGAYVVPNFADAIMIVPAATANIDELYSKPFLIEGFPSNDASGLPVVVMRGTELINQPMPIINGVNSFLFKNGTLANVEFSVYALIRG